jgi:hypothetical protein
MKKFILKSGMFVMPFLLAYLVNLVFNKTNEGDLMRIGFLYSNPVSFSEVNKRFEKKSKNYTLLSELSPNLKGSFNVMTIGDSFSNLGDNGYQNYLANTDTISVLHIDRFLSGNPIQTLLNLSKGDFFDSIAVEYIVLQSVEREFVKRFDTIANDSSIVLKSLVSEINTYSPTTPEYSRIFFSDATIKIPLINFLYNYQTKPLDSKTYRVKTSTDTLFSGCPDNLLFFEDDIKSLKINNDYSKIKEANEILNGISKVLAAKGIKLITLISPDKYDIYYPYIVNHEEYRKPLFFNYFNQLSKDYYDVRSNEILAAGIKQYKDVYFYDDTHWSPVAAQLIAKGLGEIITDDRKTKSEQFVK